MVALVWFVLGLLEAVKAYVMAGLGGLDVTWGQVLIGNLPWWLLWGVLTPLIFALGRRWRFAGDRVLVPLLVHVPASVVLAVTHLVVTAVVFQRTRNPTADLDAMIVAWLNSFVFLELFIYWTVLAAYHALTHYRLYRERQEAAARLELEQERLAKEIARARLHALQMELQPHFLFNTFNAITALVRQHENAQAVEMLVRLGDLLRRTLERGGTPMVSLAEEVELARCYLGIQSVRFPALDVLVDVEPEAGRARVPTLVLQPLVENAIRHGLAGTGRGTVRLTARRRGGRVRIEVENRGRGAGAGRAATRSRGSGSGVGLSNTESRLEQIWPGRASAVLERLHGDGGGGARVTLDLPWEPEIPDTLDGRTGAGGTGGGVERSGHGETRGADPVREDVRR
ncbi:MAG TPA: histidine kinase [Longimicrobiales bacterium]|nr:histidine kinase [Longimicrobiales bacterium]